MKLSLGVVLMGSAVVVLATVLTLLAALSPSSAMGSSLSSPSVREWSGPSGPNAQVADASFRTWWSSFNAKNAEGKSHESNVMLEEGFELFENRRQALARLVVDEPQQALALALRPEEIASLPAGLESRAEEWVGGDGTVSLLCPFQTMQEIINTHKRYRGHEDETPFDEESYKLQLSPEGRPLNDPSLLTRLLPTYLHTVEFTDGRIFPASAFGRRENRLENEPVPLLALVLDGHAALAEDAFLPVSLSDSTSSRHLSAAGTAHLTKLAERLTPSTVCPVSGRPAVGTAGLVNMALPSSHPDSVVFFAGADEREVYRKQVRAKEDAALAARGFINSKTQEDLSTLIMIAKFADESNYPTSVASFESLMETVEDYWYVNSYGTSTYTYTSILIDLPGTKASYSIDTSSGPCPINSGRSDALDDDSWDRATAAGELETDYDRYIIVFSSFEQCAWAGLGSVANSGTWINGRYDPVMHWHVTAHELGHNYGLKHADLQPGDENGPISTTPVVPYGDDWDVMGAVYIDTNRMTFHATTEKKWGLDWIPDADVINVLTTGNYRVFSFDFLEAEGTRALKIERGSTGAFYWMEYRTSIAYTASRPFFLNGLTIHLAYETAGFGYETDLLDMTAVYATDSNNNDLNNAALQLGTTWSDPDYDIHITPTLISAYAGRPSMDVYVYVGSSAGNSAPVITSVEASCYSPEVNEAILLTVAVTDADGDPFAVSWDFNDGSLNPSSSLVISKAFSSVGLRTISVTVSDMRGGLATAALDTISVVLVGQSSCAPCPGACSGVGICSGGACSCSLGYTDAACSTPLTVSYVTPTFAAKASGRIVTVVGTGFGSASSPTLICNFNGVGQSVATWVSSTQVTCAAPVALANTSTVIEVSPNSGVDFSNSGVVFTYGGGYCPHNCTELGVQKGVCDVGPGVCQCFPGQTGDDCWTEIGASSPTATVGPISGNSVFDVTVSGFGSSAPSAACRFGSVVAAATYDGVSLVTCVSPPFGAAVTVDLEVSPNGIDFTGGSALTFQFMPVTNLIARVPVSVVLGVGEYAYFSFEIGDPSTSVFFTRSGSAAQFYCDVGEVPTESSTPAVSNPMRLTNSSPSQQIAAGTWYCLAVATAAGTFTVEATYENSVELFVDLLAVQQALGGGPDYFTITHTQESAVVVLVSTNTGEEVTVFRTAVESESGSPTQSSTKAVVIQMCEEATTYYLGVSGTPGTIYTVSAVSTQPPQPAEGVMTVVDRFTTSLVVEFPLATDTLGYDFNMVYQLYTRPVDLTTSWDNPCLVLSSGTPASTTADVGAFYNPQGTVDGLSSSTNYEVTVLVTNSYGVQNVYPSVGERTKPPALPRDVIIMLVAASCSIVLFTAVIVAYLKFSRHGRRHHKKGKGKGKRPKKVAKKNPRTGRGTVAASAAPASAAPSAVPKANPRQGGRKGGPRADGRRVEQLAAPAPTALPVSRGATPVARTEAALAPPAAGARRQSTVPGAPSAGPPQAGKLVGGPSARPVSTGPAAAPPAGIVVAAATKAKIVGVAVSDFTAEYETELSFKTGDYIVLHKDMKNGWLRGELNGKVGLLPDAYVKKVKVVDKSSSIAMY